MKKETATHITPPRPQSWLNRLATLLVLTGCAASTFAANLINDTWRDQERHQPGSPAYSENGIDSDVDGNLESAWFNTDNSTTSMTVVDDATPGGDYTLRTVPNFTGSASWTTYLTPAASPVTLAGVGDQLRITWKFTPIGVDATNTANTGQNFRLAIVDWPETSTARLTTNGAPGTAAYAGYAMFMHMRTNYAGSFQLRERTNATVAAAFLSASAVWTGALANDASTGDGYADGTNYTFSFQATLLTGGALEILASMTGGTLGGDGQLSLTYTDAAPNSLTFDTFGVRPQTGNLTATNFITTLFKAEFTPGGCTPTSYDVTGNATVCSGGTASVGLNDSDTGLDYHLLVGGTPTGTVLPGTGSALDFGLQGVGTYTVYASNTTIACEGLMSGAAVISQYADPVVTTNPVPANAVSVVGSTRVFSIAATGPGLTYKWRKDTVELNNGGNIAGANTATLTLNNLTLGDSGAYDCVVSNSPCGASTTSAAANLSVVVSSGILFQSAGVGPASWSDPASWEQSANGVTWTPASQAPSNVDSNIVIRTGHTILVDTEQTVDELTVQSGALLSVQGGNLIINSGPGVDANVAGTLEVGAGSGAITIVAATLQFGSGGVFDWNRTTPPAIPTATWLDGSTCRITAVNSGNNSSLRASGFTGQSFYDFIYDTTAGGQVPSARCRLGLAGITEIRRDFTIKVVDTNSASVTINNADNSVLNVGRNVLFETGTASGNGNKVLPHEGIFTNFKFRIGGNFTSIGYIDGFGSSQTLFEFNGSGTQTMILPVEPFILTATAMNWTVNSGSTVQLGSTLDGFQTFTNKGTFNFGSYTIVRGTTLVFDAGGTVIGNSTNQLTLTNGVVGLNSIQLGGTLNLPGLPAFTGGESFLLFEAGTHTGAFASITPSVPGVGLTWNTSQLGTTGILAVSGGAPAATNITATPIGGGQVVLNWPTGQGWKLQTQTNALSVGLNANWVEVVGATPPLTNTISPATPAVFYRLVYP
jgi:hypothetical protein